MVKNVGNADRHDQNLPNSDHDNDVIDEDKEEFYRKMIKALTKEKFKEFCRKHKIDDDVSMAEQMELLSGSKRKGSCSSMNEVDNKKGKMVVDSDDVIRQLQEFIMSDEINGSDMKLVFEKRVYATENTLNMPFKLLETHDFLTPEEKQFLGDGSEMEVVLVRPNLQIYKKPMSLTIGGKPQNKNYMLKTNWSDFVEVNKDVLKAGAVIQVWSFRKDDQLCFAVVCVE